MSKALELADSITRMDTFTEYQRSEILKAASELRRLAAIEQAIKDAQPECHQFQTREDGKWHDFIDERHYENTVNDGRWPIRALYTLKGIKP
jgi:hypothetical protein